MTEFDNSKRAEDELWVEPQEVRENSDLEPINPEDIDAWMQETGGDAFADAAQLALTNPDEHDKIEDLAEDTKQRMDKKRMLAKEAEARKPHDKALMEIVEELEWEEERKKNQ